MNMAPFPDLLNGFNARDALPVIGYMMQAAAVLIGLSYAWSWVRRDLLKAPPGPAFVLPLIGETVGSPTLHSCAKVLPWLPFWCRGGACTTLMGATYGERAGTSGAFQGLWKGTKTGGEVALAMQGWGAPAWQSSTCAGRQFFQLHYDGPPQITYSRSPCKYMWERWISYGGVFKVGPGPRAAWGSIAAQNTVKNACGACRSWKWTYGSGVWCTFSCCACSMSTTSGTLTVRPDL